MYFVYVSIKMLYTLVPADISFLESATVITKILYEFTSD